MHATCRCKQAAEESTTTAGASPFARSSAQSSTASARRLGHHYLQRYFFLITFICFLAARTTNPQGGSFGLSPPSSFTRWMADRHELKHLLSTLSLEST